MDFLEGLTSFVKKETRPGMIISTGGGGGGGGGSGGGAGGAGGSVHIPLEKDSLRRERVVIILLIALLVWFGIAVVRLENYHYAVQVGFCEEYLGVESLPKRDKCLNEMQTRTSPLYHLLYGLKIW